MSPFTLDRALLIRAGLSVILAAAVFAILSLVGRAPDQAARLAAQTQAMAELRTLPDPSKAGAYPPDAVCRLGLAPAATVLKARIVNAAGAAGVTLGEMSLTASPDGETQRLSIVHVALAGEGPYLSDLAFMRILAEGDPALFVDHLRIARLAGGRAGLTLEGRIHCSLGEAP
jgi:hypothetical protein